MPEVSDGPDFGFVISEFFLLPLGLPLPLPPPPLPPNHRFTCFVDFVFAPLGIRDSLAESPSLDDREDDMAVGHDVST